MLGDFFEDFESWVQTYHTNPNSSESRDTVEELYEMALQQKQAFEEDVILSSTERNEILALFTPIVDGLLAAKNGTLANLRVKNDCKDDINCMLQALKDIYNLFYSYYGKNFQFSLDPFCEKNLDGSSKCGAVPKIIWQNSLTDSQAFGAGIIDGAYLTLKDTGATIYTIKEVAACFSPYSYINDTNDCRKKISNGFQLIVAVASVIKDNPETAWRLVKTEAEKFVDNYVGSEPINKYYKGRFAFEVLSMFIGVGEVSATLKTLDAVKLSKLLENTAKAASEFNVVGRMMSKVGVVITKTGNKAGAFIIRRADGTIDKIVGRYINGVYKGFKQYTSAYTKRIGTFIGDVELADGTKGKGTYEFWGNCGSISNFRTATDPVPNCGDIASKLLRKVWQPIQRIKNKHPNDPMPKDAKLDFIAEIEDGRITNRNENGMSYLRDFVVTTEGELIVGKRHHFLANTKDVEAAGMIKVVNGKIRRLDNYSGHYFPSIKETEKFPLIFKELGLNIKGSTLQTWYLDEKNVLQSFEKVIHE